NTAYDGVLHAASCSGLLDLLPWCGTRSTSQWSGFSASTSSKPGDCRSAGNSIRLPAYSTDITILLAFDVDGSPCGGGWRISSRQPGPPERLSPDASTRIGTRARSRCS